MEYTYVRVYQFILCKIKKISFFFFMHNTYIFLKCNLYHQVVAYFKKYAYIAPIAYNISGIYHEHVIF